MIQITGGRNPASLIPSLRWDKGQLFKPEDFNEADTANKG